MIGPNSVGSAQMLGGGGGARFPFNSVTPPPPPPQSASKPLESLSVNPYDGSSPPGLRPSVGGSGGGFSIDSGNKKKRGRPRKYSPDGNIALGLSPTPIPSSAAVGSGGHGESGGTTPSSEASGKKHRGRPPGSSKRQLDALGKFEFFLEFSVLYCCSISIWIVIPCLCVCALGRYWWSWVYSSCNYGESRRGIFDV